MKAPKTSRKAQGDPLESVIEKKVCDYAKNTYGVKHYKFASPNRRSVPDRLLLWPGGYVLFIEFKRKGKLPTEGQKREMDRIGELEFKVLVIDRIDFGKMLIDAVASEFGVEVLV